MDLKILITGANGMLGQELMRVFPCAVGVDVSDFDLTDFDKTRKEILKIKPDLIIHAAAYTKVDDAENEKDLCFKINTEATKNIAQICQDIDAVLCFISTDFVFDGEKQGAYVEEDIPNPIGVYGASKFQAEECIKEVLDKYFIVRIAWLYGAGGSNFVKTITKYIEAPGGLDMPSANEPLKIVDDQVGSPTYTKDVAEILPELIKTKQYGIYHLTNNGSCSWYEFAKKIVELSDKDIEVVPIKSKDLARPAKRPANSALDCGKINIVLDRSVMRRWDEALKDFIDSKEFEES